MRSSDPSKFLMSFHPPSRQDPTFLWLQVSDYLPPTIPSRFAPLSNRTAGDFEEIYGAEENDADEPSSGQWDAVLTCFFIDTVCMLPQCQSPAAILTNRLA